AYSSGTPALGVGPGNVPAFIERTCDIPSAVRRIMASKTFDNGTVCASEQAIVTETCIRDQVVAEFKKQGGYFVSGEEEKKLAAVIMRPGSDTVNPRIVGRSALDISGMAGIQVPQTTRVLLCHQEHVGREYPFSIEKLSPILAFYTEPDWQKACERCMELIRFAGLGHSCALHTENPELVRAFLLKKPVSRLLINTGSTQGGIGASTGIMPSLTLGCGAVGGSATSDNVTVHHLYQVRRAAWGLIEPEDAEGGRASAPTPACAPEHRGESLSEAQREQIVEAVLRQIRQGSSWSNT
ncbi:MAG: acetaldehyde dehydrogenase, partial [Clostridiales bacterium]|nr:acetaldehyde dehydrogenase [Clostridiales bacterium]